VQDGRAYVTGETSSADYPTTTGAFDRTFNSTDAFVTKLNASGSTLAYSTFLGGGDLDQGSGIAVDGSDRAYVTGFTSSTDYPTTPGAFDRTFNDGGDVFVTKLNAAGSRLVYSTYLAGASIEFSAAIAVRDGRAYVTGQTRSTDYPTTTGAFDRTFNGGIADAFVTKLNAAGSKLDYSTFLGGTEFDQGSGIAVDGSGRAYLTGFTSSPDYPTMGAFDTIIDGNFDAFVSKLNAAGSMLAYSTYLGGTNQDQGEDIAVDGSGRANVTGDTSSPDYPTMGAFDATLDGLNDAFVTKLPTG
jgi:Beta-propeller repeat